MVVFNFGELHPNTPYLFADLAELALLVGYNGRTRLHKNDLESILAKSVISPDELDDEEDAEGIENLATAEKNDRQETQLEDVLTQLSYRFKALDDCYPFVVQGEMVIPPENQLKRK